MDLKTWQKCVFFAFAMSVTALGTKELYKSSKRGEKIDTYKYFVGAFGPRNFDSAISNQNSKNDFFLIKRVVSNLRKG